MCLYMLLYMAIEFFGICLVYIEASNLTDILFNFHPTLDSSLENTRFYALILVEINMVR